MQHTLIMLFAQRNGIFRSSRDVNNGSGGNDNKGMLAVEIPLMFFAITTVLLRLYSRLRVKKQLAVDDVLIVCGLVSEITSLSFSGYADAFSFSRLVALSSLA